MKRVYEIRKSVSKYGRSFCMRKVEEDLVLPKFEEAYYVNTSHH